VTSLSPPASALAALASGEASLADALDLSPAVIEQLVDKAMGLAKYGKLDQASKLLSDLALVDRRSAMLPLLLGTIRATAADHDGALAAYDEAIARDERGASSKRFRAEALMLRARSALAVGDAATAREDLRHAAAADVEELSVAARTLLKTMEDDDAHS
jgi:tetratricopeptide (TPR) repeat protein